MAQIFREKLEAEYGAFRERCECDKERKFMCKEFCDTYDSLLKAVEEMENFSPSSYLIWMGFRNVFDSEMKSLYCVRWAILSE